jgi:hypothetical protein
MRSEKYVALAAAMFAAAGACAQVVEVLYTNDAASANSDVPGLVGVKFASFDRPLRSPGGTKYIMLARNNTGAMATDAMYLVGDTSTGAASVVVQEGVTPVEGARVATNMSDRRAGVLDNGDFALVIDLDGATTDDKVVLKSTGGVWSFPLREGDALGALPGVFIGITITDVNLLSDGTVTARFDSMTGAVASTTNSALLAGNGATLLAREQTTMPTNQLGSELWSAFDSALFWADASGNWLSRGSLTGVAASNVVVGVNNTIVIQESAFLVSLASPVANVISARMEINGDWFARGELADDTAYMVRNGVVAASAGPSGSSDIPGVPGETFSNAVWNVTNGNTFFMGIANGVGDYVVGGFTSSINPLTNAVWTLNNDRVFMRRGVTEVDLNGNGLADDNAFVGITGATGASLNNITDGAILTDDGWFYFMGDVVDSSGTLLTSAFMRVRAFEPEPQCPVCAADYDGNGGVDGGDLAAFFADFESGEGCADVDGNGGVDGGDLGFFFTVFEQGGC